MVAGALLLATYAALFPILLPLGSGSADYAEVVSSPWWRGLAATALTGTLFLLIGVDAVHAAIHRTGGLSGWLGLVLLKIALTLQASKVVVQLLFEPLLAAHPATAFLLRDAVLLNDPAVTVFRLGSSIALVLGSAMFGTALYRSRLFPKTAVALIGAGAFVYAVGFVVSMLLTVSGIVILAAGCVVVGARLWTMED